MCACSKIFCFVLNSSTNQTNSRSCTCSMLAMLGVLANATCATHRTKQGQRSKIHPSPKRVDVDHYACRSVSKERAKTKPHTPPSFSRPRFSFQVAAARCCFVTYTEIEMDKVGRIYVTHRFAFCFCLLVPPAFVTPMHTSDSYIKIRKLYPDMHVTRDR